MVVYYELTDGLAMCYINSWKSYNDLKTKFSLISLQYVDEKLSKRILAQARKQEADLNTEDNE